MKTIPLTQGMEAIVDDENYKYLAQFKWHAHKGRHTFYAQRDVGSSRNGTQKHILMHRVIMNAKDGEIVDHENQNGLDNRKENLRKISHGRNIRNSKYTKGSTGYYGVTPHRNKFRAYIHVNRKSIYLGVFGTAEEAARAYDVKSNELFGDGKVNFPTGAFQ